MQKRKTGLFCFLAVLSFSAYKTELGVAVSQSICTARDFLHAVMQKFWKLSRKRISSRSRREIRPLFKEAGKIVSLSAIKHQEAAHLASMYAEMDLLEAAFQVGEFYTKLLPKEYRSSHGIYFTPPSLTSRLLNNAESAGTDWAVSSVIDPACGGGAFLAPVALRMKEVLRANGCSPDKVVRHISRNLVGQEIDPFSAWLSQVFVDLVLLDECVQSNYKMPILVRVTDSLIQPVSQTFDLVVGNPPYSKVKLNDDIRERFSRSIYGHVNLYGLFTDKALSLLKQGGILAYVTPTSFLAGQYFKNLRRLLSDETVPICMDFIEARSGVFENVLQETLLTVFRKGLDPIQARSSSVIIAGNGFSHIVENGCFNIQRGKSAPWMIPRTRQQADILENAVGNNARLKDYGYKVSTGPLVWNRHKDRIVERAQKNTLPLVWAESVMPDGSFQHKSERRNHKPWFRIDDERDNWLIAKMPCLLLQRTTAKEQKSRLNAAELPESFIRKYGGVVIENHLNMVRPIENAAISLQTLAFILRSRVVDQLFRAMNGSVAVSAYELEALPLPPIEKAKCIQGALENRIDTNAVEQMIEDAYREQFTQAA
ncbi:MAG: N-6 DNA methylase [gamma proteobacterium endosymbiont of Lamellibrachia anaximandri]|nr:N-6 DNA methylase [gamma proteobacterium endosymbiont of Lamellibrachia anaximandri]